MAQYVFKAQLGYDRRVLEDEEKNRVIVNSQSEYDYYTMSRPGGPYNGSYWQDIASAGPVTDALLQQLDPEYQQKSEAGDEVLESDVDVSTLNPSGPGGDPGTDLGDDGQNVTDTTFGAGSTTGNLWTGRDKGNIPSGAEYWNVDGNYYIVYYIPGTGTPIYYDSSLDDLQNIFGPVEFPAVEASIKTPTPQQWNKAIRFGDSLELADPNIYNPEQSPWVSFVDTVAKESKIRPWLNDSEMIELLAEATLEGRTVSDAEWQSTNWWREHTQAERDWLLLAQTGTTDFSSVLTADAQRKIDEDKLAVKNLMEQSGISNPSDELVSWVGQKLTTGLWSDSYTAEQVKVLSDPTLEANIDTDLDNFIASGEIDYDTTRAGESQVKRLVKEYLGPVFGGNIADTQLAKWAGMVRNDPDAEINIKETLLKMKKGLYPGYDDELTYEEIAAPWRGFTTNTWGGTVDENSKLFQDVVKANDVTKANEILYMAGLQNDGSDKIKTEVKNSIVGAFGGGSVRRIV